MLLINKIKSLTDKKILFVHIPKSAGQSILHFIRYNIFKDREPKWYYIGTPLEFASFQNLSGDILAGYDFLGGHVSLEVFKNKLKDHFYSFFSFSILRNPIDRAISLYFYILSNPNHYQHSIVNKMNIFDFISSEHYPRNHQCHLFKTNSTAEEAIDFIENNLDALGFFEDLDSVVKFLSAKFGIEDLKLPYINKTPNKKFDFDLNSIINLVNEVDKEDIILYNHFMKLIL